MANTNMDWGTIPVQDQRHLLDVIGNDGHTIYSANWLGEHQIHQGIIEYFAMEYTSDGSLKGSIEQNGQYVESMDGIYGLHVLESMARHYGVSSDAIGRGFRARALTEGLKERLA